MVWQLICGLAGLAFLWCFLFYVMAVFSYLSFVLAAVAIVALLAVFGLPVLFSVCAAAGYLDKSKEKVYTQIVKDCARIIFAVLVGLTMFAPFVWLGYGLCRALWQTGNGIFIPVTILICFYYGKSTFFMGTREILNMTDDL